MPLPFQDPDAVIYQGADYVRTYRWLQDGVPVNLTGAVIESDIRKSISGPVILSFSTTDNSITIDDAADGTFSLRASEVATAAIALSSERKLVQDVLVTLNGITERVIEATPTFSPGVTRG